MKRGIRDFLKRGFVATVGFITTGSAAVNAGAASSQFGPPYAVDVRSGGTAGNEVLNLPLVGDFIGQRLLVTFRAEGNAADVVRINAAATGQLLKEGWFIDGVTGYTNGGTVITNVDLDTPGEYALFEFIGGATSSWNLVYTTGAVS